MGMVIDSHQHFWKYRPDRFPWITEDMAALRKDFLPEDLGPILQANNVEGCIAVQARTSEEETEFLLDCAKDWPVIRGVVGWVDLCSDRVASRLDTLCRNPILKGFRHIVQDEPDDRFMLREDFRRGISQLGARGLTYDILIYPRQLPAAISLVQHFPDQRFILDHLGKPAIGATMDTQWKEAMARLGSFDNVFCKLSGMVTETVGFRWNKEQIFPFLDHAMATFGTSRLMVGSDWPVCLLAAEYAEVMDIVSSYLASFSEEEKAGILGQNAVKCYGLIVPEERSGKMRNYT